MLFLKEISNETKRVVNYDDKTIFPSHLLTFTSFPEKILHNMVSATM